MVSKNPFQLSTVCSQLLEFGIKTTKKSLKRFLKSLGYSYKRARAKIMKCDKEAFKEAKKEIEHFKEEAEKDNSLHLYFFDESSFSLSPNIPYGWSQKNETITLEAKRSKALKVLGFLGLDNQLKSYTTTGSIDAVFLIKIFDDFVASLPKESTTIVILEGLPLEGTMLQPIPLNSFKLKLKSGKKKD